MLIFYSGAIPASPLSTRCPGSAVFSCQKSRGTWKGTSVMGKIFSHNIQENRVIQNPERMF